MEPIISIITPTTGKKSVFNLINSIKEQKIPVRHIILFDNKRDKDFCYNFVEVNEEFYSTNNIVINGSFVQGKACGSALRAVGLMIANTEYTTFADDDVLWECGHLQSLIDALKNQNKKWGFCKRKIWTQLPDGQYEYLGVDNFESVGDEAKTPYKMVDNNCMIFQRRFGTSAACLYRETQDYNDDRLMYDFLTKYAGEPAKTNIASVNQVCPNKLVEFFRRGCTI